MKNLTKNLLTILLTVSTIFSFGQNLIEFQDKNNNWGFKDSTGNVVIKPIYDDVLNFSEGFALVKLNYKWGYINKEGKEIIPLGKYDDIKNLSDGFI